MSVLDAARNLADDYPGGAKALAGRLEKNPFTLMHELSETGTAKLGLKTAVQMTTRSGDLRILNAFAGECGCMVIPLPEALQVDGSVTMQHMGKVAKEFGDLIQEVTNDIGDDGEISQNEMARIEREWSELVAAGQAMLAHLRAKRAADETRRGGLQSVSAK